MVERSLTEPEPFDLVSVRRHDAEMRRLESEKAQRAAEEEKARQFKARSLPSAYPLPLQPPLCCSTLDLRNFALNSRTAPFEVKKSAKPLTEISNLELKSDRRAAERTHFDEHVRAKEAALEAMKEKSRQEEVYSPTLS
jgi:targeting protein for Xklp2